MKKREWEKEKKKAEFRYDPAREKWVIISSARRGRPKITQEDMRICPFCPGNESEIPEPVLIEGDIRVIPNRFPALVNVKIKKNVRKKHFTEFTAPGYHEVVIETLRHDIKPHEIEEEHLSRVIKVYMERYKSISRDRRIKYVIIFKNYGKEAGASISHPHSQIIALPFIPPQIQKEVRNAKKLGCLTCISMRKSKSERRLVFEDEKFAVFCPPVPAFPFETWIVPKEHSGDFLSISASPQKIHSFSSAMIKTFKAMHRYFGDIHFNFMIMSFPAEEKFHWRAEIIPRKNHAIAGFEIATGIMINPFFPDETASEIRRRLR